jgi:hypothetical protein
LPRVWNRNRRPRGDEVTVLRRLWNYREAVAWYALAPVVLLVLVRRST